MRKTQRVIKGQYGYMVYQKKFTMIRSIAYFGISLAIYIMGRISTGTNANLLSVVAVLGCLPASKSMVNAIMFLRAKECSEDLHRKIEPAVGELDGGYDFLLTSYSANFALSHVVIRGNNLCGITEDPRCDVTKAQQHLDDLFRQNSFKGMTFKIFTEPGKYTERLQQLQKLEKSGQEAEMLQLVGNLSL